MPSLRHLGFAPRIERCLAGLCADAGPDTVRGLAALLDRVVEWNDKVDLTAPR